MPLYRLQVAMNGETAEPRDRMVNVLHFNVAGLVQDIDQLCRDLRDIYTSGWFSGPTVRGIRVTAYEVGLPPQYPKGYAEAQPGTVSAGGAPAELALCLSFYGDRNLPRTRGRIYLPMAPTAIAVGANPSPGTQTKALALATSFSSLGGANVDWCIYSPTTKEHVQVKNAWVDNRWDIQRRRGPKQTSRVTAAVSG